MIQGLRTAIYNVEDVTKAKEWYATALGIQPYFDEPFYVGFNIGGYELGLHPVDEVTKGDNVLIYWGVADAKAQYARLLGLGAEVHQEVSDVGDGILVGTVLDPFGNIFGIIQNPHFTLSDQLS